MSFRRLVTQAIARVLGALLIQKKKGVEEAENIQRNPVDCQEDLIREGFLWIRSIAQEITGRIARSVESKCPVESLEDRHGQYFMEFEAVA